VNGAVMSLFATGMTTGIVLECGDAVTYAVPVFEGFALPHATKRINVGGKHVTAYLIKMLQDRSKSSNVAESQAFASRIDEFTQLSLRSDMLMGAISILVTL